MTTRQAFETEAKKHGFILDRLDKSGVYVQLITEQAWSTWQAATNAALDRAAEVCEAIENGEKPDGSIAAGLSWECADAIRALKEKP